MMADRETIEELIQNQSVASVLRRRSTYTEEVRALQIILYELGFENELNWQKYGADGDYGGGTSRAVKAFAERNGLSGNGETVTPAIAEKLIERYDLLDDLRHIQNALVQDKAEQLYFRNSPHSTAVAALQTLLNVLGFGAELNWAKYGADGKYGAGTAKAVKAFARREGISSDGRFLSAELARRIIERLENFYGPNWSEDRAPVEKTATDITVREAVENGRPRIYVSLAGNAVRFTKFKRGVYVFGQRKPLDFIDANRPSLSGLGLTDSAINVMAAVSENEGNLDAINTWDNAFLTFGMFQWTAGVGDGREKGGPEVQIGFVEYEEFQVRGYQGRGQILSFLRDKSGLVFRVLPCGSAEHGKLDAVCVLDEVANSAAGSGLHLDAQLGALQEISDARVVPVFPMHVTEAGDSYLVSGRVLGPGTGGQ